jgi:4-amino-4-deoxy-L-arabinose transferase-like glycosyltransferase
MNKRISVLWFLGAMIWSAWCVGMLGRGYWTPDEPREADIAWRMSWQADQAVPLLAGEAFCEKPPLTYWLAAASMRAFGDEAWAARLPNLLYALITALGVGLLARRAAGPAAGPVVAVAAAAAISTFLLSYQVAIWLATDAPLLATVSVALLGAYIGFYAAGRGERLRGYLLMHAALAVGFLCKSAAAWMVPALTIVTLALWERRLRELWRWELYLGLGLQAAIILPWVWSVYLGPDGLQHLKVFFWNNLVGRFTNVAAPADLQYTTAHRNSPGKYLLELPLYLWPWTILCVAAARRAWQQRRPPRTDASRLLPFAAASFLPTLAVLSVAATARNIYLAPALPGVALLLGWWIANLRAGADRWDLRALKATAALLMVGLVGLAALLAVAGVAEHRRLDSPLLFGCVSALGLGVAAYLLIFAWRALRQRQFMAACLALLVAYCSVLVGPASQAYGIVDQWQDLADLGAQVRADLGTRALVLLAPDETTRAWVDMYTRENVNRVPGPIDAAALARVQDILSKAPHDLVLVQLPGRAVTPEWQSLARRFGKTVDPADFTEPSWLETAGLVTVKLYAEPNGRRYALLTRGR